ncbi:MAG: MBL fold metallo-hydrolase [Ignavibacteria bacterium]|nr:MBL fold metallo-hydrolase [Ignavibacteria bacterium]
MKVIVTGSGTSQGIPVIGCDCAVCRSRNPKDKRLRASVYIETGRLKLVIDTSVDFRQQMLRNKLYDIDAVLFTHHHVDHIFGFDDIRQINQQQKKIIDIYGSRRTVKELKITFRYALDKELIRYKCVPIFRSHFVSGKKFKIRDTEIIPIKLKHGHLDILGYRINDFAYITDCSHIPENEFLKLKNLKVLIINALRRRPHPTHFSVEEAVNNARRINAEMTYLTHMTHDIPHNKTNKILPQNIRLSYDGLIINI